MFKPLGDWLIIEPIKKELTASGIIRIDSSSANALEQGTVIAKGPGKRMPSAVVAEAAQYPIEQIQIGDTVTYFEYDGKTELEKGKVLLNANDVLAIVTNG